MPVLVVDPLEAAEIEEDQRRALRLHRWKISESARRLASVSGSRSTMPEILLRREQPLKPDCRSRRGVRSSVAKHAVEREQPP